MVPWSVEKSGAASSAFSSSAVISTIRVGIYVAVASASLGIGG